MNGEINKLRFALKIRKMPYLLSASKRSRIGNFMRKKCQHLGSGISIVKSLIRSMLCSYYL